MQRTNVETVVIENDLGERKEGRREREGDIKQECDRPDRRQRQAARLSLLQEPELIKG